MDRDSVWSAFIKPIIVIMVTMSAIALMTLNSLPPHEQSGSPDLKLLATGLLACIAAVLSLVFIFTHEIPAHRTNRKRSKKISRVERVKMPQPLYRAVRADMLFAAFILGLLFAVYCMLYSYVLPTYNPQKAHVDLLCLAAIGGLAVFCIYQAYHLKTPEYEYISS